MGTLSSVDGLTVLSSDCGPSNDSTGCGPSVLVELDGADGSLSGDPEYV